MNKALGRQITLAGLSSALGVAGLLAVPTSARADGCETSACTYYGGGGGTVGHCGPWDTSCGCFENAGNGGQHQTACAS